MCARFWTRSCLSIFLSSNRRQRKNIFLHFEINNFVFIFAKERLIQRKNLKMSKIE
jgi:hypothetical protein